MVIMLPESQSSDASRQSRTYRSRPSAKQVRFPTRRSKVRGQGKGSQKRDTASLKQQTLTQMDFVSSFSEEPVTLSDDDDDASDEPACGPDRLAVPQKSSEAEAQLEERPQESTRGSTPVIQDSFASPEDNLSPQFSPPRFQPTKVRDAVLSPIRLKRMGSVDVKASPRRRAHWSGSLEGPKRFKASREENMSSPTRIYPLATDADDREIPDSDEEYEELELLEDDRLIYQDTFETGYETQRALEELASIDYLERDEEEQEQGQDAATNQSLASSIPHSSVVTSSGSSTDCKAVPRLEAADHLPTNNASLQSPTISPSPKLANESPRQTELSQRRHDQIFESQRVPIHVLQSFTPVSARTDILLPTPSKVLSPLVDGSETILHLPYRVPEQVRRFWLLDQETLRYMACVQPGKPSGPGWGYHVDQVYELNNPIEERDMQEEGWVTGQVRRYIYLPPAIVGQLLWNLRCATFDRAGLDHDDDDDENSQKNSNLEALGSRSPESSMPSQPLVHPESGSINHDTGQPSSLVFQDHGSSLATLPTNAVFDSSPLLTKSQMLPDSLLSDDVT
ncbi:hypothetical protein V8C35DRAFT_204876 [Trichoderma chlorosporum]